MRVSVYLVLGILALGLLSCAAGASVVNLTQPYTWIGGATQIFQSDPQGSTSYSYNSATDGLAITWVEITDFHLGAPVYITLTFNDGSTLEGVIDAEDNGWFSGKITVQLGDSINTTEYSTIWASGNGIGDQILTYGVDDSGYCYLTIMPSTRTGGGKGPAAALKILLDTDRDSYGVVNPPSVNPIVKIDVSSTKTFVTLGNGLTPEQVVKSTSASEDTDWLSLLFSAVNMGVVIFTGVIGFVVGWLIPNFGLAILIGEGLCLLWSLRQTDDVVEGLGLFFKRNLWFADILQKIIMYCITAFWSVIDAIKLKL